MKLYSYVVARDFGFAPNPFCGVCTLAACKPQIRAAAQIGDWIVGTGSKSYGLSGALVYAMQVAEVMGFDEYWNAPQFVSKRPNLRGSLKQAFGDNIYHRSSTTGRWMQEDSHHSFRGGRPNKANIEHDTQVPRVLIGREFVYFGKSGPKIPRRFRAKTLDICAHRGHKCNFPDSLVRAFLAWIQSLNARGCVEEPAEFDDLGSTEVEIAS